MNTRLFPLLTLTLLLAAACGAQATPTMLNNIPTTDINAHETLTLWENFYKYNYKNTVVPEDRSSVHSLEYGIRNVEFGVDIVGNRDFLDWGLYATGWNLKWRLFDEGPAPVALALGVTCIGAKKVPGLEDWAYKPSPYIVLGKKLGEVRLTLGYTKSLYGFTRIDNVDVDGDGTLNGPTDTSRKNDGVIVGLDGVIWKSERHPLTLMVDYYGGPMATMGYGLYQPITERLSWTFLHSRPVKSALRDSGAELPTQNWAGLCYTIPLGKKGKAPEEKK